MCIFAGKLKTLNMIQSHYIPLEPPYRIIYSGGVLGLQIGTLLVVHDNNTNPITGKRITISPFKTDSYPVVSYVNKKNTKQPLINDMKISGLYSEGVVWENVTQDQVATLCLEGQEVDWDDYIDLLGPDFYGYAGSGSPLGEKLSSYQIPKLHEAFRKYELFYNLGGKLKLPNYQKKELDKETHKQCYYFEIGLIETTSFRTCIDSPDPVYYSDLGDAMRFYAYNQDVESAYKELERQRQFYLSILDKILPDQEIARITFKLSGDKKSERLSQLIQILNSQT